MTRLLWCLLPALASCAAPGPSPESPEKASPPGNPSKVRKAEGGLMIQDLKIGEGPTAQAGDTLVVHYTGRLANGSKFDSSLDRGEPFTFVLGEDEVIEGWDKGLASMRVGGKRRLIVPPQLAYGERGYPGRIPPKATIEFTVELLEIKKE